MELWLADGCELQQSTGLSPVNKMHLLRRHGTKGM